MKAARRPSIVQQINAIRRERADLPLRLAQGELARILDGLNAFGALEDVRRARYNRLLSYGPKAVSGLTPAPWVGVVIWHRPAGYYGYKTLSLLGVWARYEGAQPLILVGTKTLAYATEFFDAEAYHKLIKKGFDLYYKDDGEPPQRVQIVPYVPAERLELRDQLLKMLAEV